MNKREVYKKKKEVLELFESRTISGKQGYVKLWGDDNGHCTDSHELTKFLICKKLRFFYGFDIWTEAEFKSGGRVDILCIDKQGNGCIIEILETETEAKFSHKESLYPLPIIKVNAGIDVEKWSF